MNSSSTTQAIASMPDFQRTGATEVDSGDDQLRRQLLWQIHGADPWAASSQSPTQPTDSPREDESPTNPEMGSYHVGSIDPRILNESAQQARLSPDSEDDLLRDLASIHATIPDIVKEEDNESGSKEAVDFKDFGEFLDYPEGQKLMRDLSEDQTLNDPCPPNETPTMGSSASSSETAPQEQNACGLQPQLNIRSWDSTDSQDPYSTNPGQDLETGQSYLSNSQGEPIANQDIPQDIYYDDPSALPHTGNYGVPAVNTNSLASRLPYPTTSMNSIFTMQGRLAAMSRYGHSYEQIHGTFSNVQASRALLTTAVSDYTINNVERPALENEEVSWDYAVNFADQNRPGAQPGNDTIFVDNTGATYSFDFGPPINNHNLRGSSTAADDQLISTFTATPTVNASQLPATVTNLQVNTTTPVDANNPFNVSDFRNGENWDAHNPPAILGMLDPPPTWGHEGAPVVLRNGQGNAVFHATSNLPLHDLPIPQQLSSDLSPLHMEAYMRFDSRITYQELRARQPAGNAAYTKKQINALNNRRAREARKPLNMVCWNMRFQKPTKSTVEILDKLSDEQLSLNTTWIVTPHGVHPPTNPNCLYRRDCFLQPGHQQSESTVKGLQQLHRLRTRAHEQGLQHWRDLPSDQKEHEWRVEVAKKSKRNRNEDDNDEGEAEGGVPRATGGGKRQRRA